MVERCALCLSVPVGRSCTGEVWGTEIEWKNILLAASIKTGNAFEPSQITLTRVIFPILICHWCVGDSLSLDPGFVFSKKPVYESGELQEVIEDG